MSWQIEAPNWPLAYCGEPDGVETCSSLAGLSSSMEPMVTQMATTFLWNATRQQFGTVTMSVRPCRENGIPWSTYRGARPTSFQIPWYGTYGAWGSPVNPALIGGQWFNLPCGSCGDRCSCDWVEKILLPGPVASIGQILLNGAVLDPSVYRVDNGHQLVRLDGTQWPMCQNMAGNPATDPNTFEVTYDIGVPVPVGGQIAAGVLACQMAKAVCRSSSCELPQRIQTITRNGVTVAMLNQYDELYKELTTGLWIVDSWVASINRRRGGARVASVDRPSIRRTTWP